MCTGKHIEQCLNPITNGTSLQIIELSEAYLATTVLLQVTLELLNLSDKMKCSADHFKKAHDRLEDQKKDSEFESALDNSADYQLTGSSFRSSK